QVDPSTLENEEGWERAEAAKHDRDGDCQKDKADGGRGTDDRQPHPTPVPAEHTKRNNEYEQRGRRGGVQPWDRRERYRRDRCRPTTGFVAGPGPEEKGRRAGA